ncbi:uncharacterized protein [Antedon mediterranea]|uniref:uncharacterized protein n=1 Tax=Antedon mediterranea TaxID=105859 RepID=UPI003AF6A95C
MGLSTEEACDILGIPRGADEEEIRAAYKKLALKWHPDKHHNSESATKKFQEVSAAYKRLTSDEPEDGSEIILSPSDMFDLFARMFFNARFNNFYDSDDFDDGSDYSNDSDFLNEDDDDLQFIHYLANNSGRGIYTNKTDENVTIKKNRPSEDEARKNADELVKEEEKQRKQREKKKAKKKRQKEKKRIEKGTNEKAKNTDSGEKINENIAEKKNEESYIATENNYSERLDETESSKTAENKKYTDKKNTTKENVEQNQQKPKIKKDPTNKKLDSHGNTGPSDEEGQGWDTHSAFFTRAAATATKKITTTTTTTKKKDKKSKDQGESIEGMDPVVLKSRKVAVKGNEMANQGLYSDAIQLFTEAINLDSKDFRFFGNRSFCYDRIGQHDKALEDAKKAIQLNKDWPKGYFRKGRALAGLKLYSDAEAAFEHVLKLDKECDDAVQELIRVRTHQLIEMGFSRQQSEAAIRQYTSVQAALDSLLSGIVPQTTETEEDIYISDEEDYLAQTLTENRQDSRNPENLTSLWIGNVQSTVTQKILEELFSQWGPVTSVRMLPEKFCAFVNFKNALSASTALEKLQGKDFHGRQLLIKFPDNPIVSGQPRTTIIRKNVKPTAPVAASKPMQKTQFKPQPQKVEVVTKPSTVTEIDKTKVKGPVNGNECYFWRTTGCAFGDSCRYTHTPGNKGVDRKPWQKPSA